MAACKGPVLHWYIKNYETQKCKFAKKINMKQWDGSEIHSSVKINFKVDRFSEIFPY